MSRIARSTFFGLRDHRISQPPTAWVVSQAGCLCRNRTATYTSLTEARCDTGDGIETLVRTNSQVRGFVQYRQDSRDDRDGVEGGNGILMQCGHEDQANNENRDLPYTCIGGRPYGCQTIALPPVIPPPTLLVRSGLPDDAVLRSQKNPLEGS